MKLSQNSIRRLVAVTAVTTLAGGGWWISSRTSQSDASPVAQPQQEAVPPVPSEVAADENRSLYERIQAARDLPLRMEDGELQRLLDYLEKPLPATGRENALVSLNEVMEQLRLRGRATRQYGLALARIIGSPDSDPVVKDYAVQHAVRWMIDSEEASAEGHSPESLADRKELVARIGNLLGTRELQTGSAWGTTLNALQDMRRNTRDTADVDAVFAKAAPQIMEVAAGRETAYLGNRVAAIQSLSGLPDKVASRSLVRSLVSDPQAAVSVKLPAIATLGILGDATDLETLRGFDAANSRLRHAALAAAGRLEGRSGSN